MHVSNVVMYGKKALVLCATSTSPLLAAMAPMTVILQKSLAMVRAEGRYSP